MRFIKFECTDDNSPGTIYVAENQIVAIHKQAKLVLIKDSFVDGTRSFHTTDECIEKVLVGTE